RRARNTAILHGRTRSRYTGWRRSADTSASSTSASTSPSTVQPATVRIPSGARRADVPRIDVPDGPGGPPRQVWNLRPELLPTVSAMIEGPYKHSLLPVREREV